MDVLRNNTTSYIDKGFNSKNSPFIAANLHKYPYFFPLKNLTFIQNLLSFNNLQKTKKPLGYLLIFS